MAINLYTGLMGAGKSMELMRSVIIPALKAGRRVVTNIDGLDEDLVREYLKNKGFDVSKMGTVLHVKSADFISPDFFPQSEGGMFNFPLPSWLNAKALKVWADFYTETHARPFKKRAYDTIIPHLTRLHEAEIDVTSAILETVSANSRRPFNAADFLTREKNTPWLTLPPSPPAVVLGGDLIVIDEAWKFLAKKSEVPFEFIDFVRMHRHYADPDTGQTCDIVLAAQRLNDLQDMILDVVEFHYAMKKFKSLGAPTRYRVDVFEGPTQLMSRRNSYTLNSYDKEIFPLYKSYESGSGKETLIDERSTLVSKKMLIIYGVAFLLFISIVGFGLTKILKPETYGGKSAKKNISSIAVATNPANASSAPKTQLKPNILSVHSVIVGKMSIGKAEYLVINDNNKVVIESNAKYECDNPTFCNIKYKGEDITIFASIESKSPNIMK
jgi:zona occludens toxin (predicted ATPase)